MQKESKTAVVLACILALVASGFTTALGFVGASRVTQGFSHEFGKYLAMFSMLMFVIVLIILINVLKGRIDLNPKFRSF